MARLDEVLTFDDKNANLKRRKEELESMGEGKAGARGSTKSAEDKKKEAVSRAGKVKDVNGKEYDRQKQFDKDTER